MQTKTNSATFSSPRFALGQIVATPAVLEHFERHGVNASEYVNRHVRGDWGDVRAEHRRYNNAALELGGYLLSSYTISNGLALCIFTEADRNLTAVFLLDEY